MNDERHAARNGVPGFLYVDVGAQMKALKHSSLSLHDVDGTGFHGNKNHCFHGQGSLRTGTVKRRYRVLRESLEKLNVNSTAIMTALCTVGDAIFQDL